MNAEQAKKLNLPRILAQLGYAPVRSLKGGQEHWYASPFREETDPSFHTSFLGGKWIWNDFGDTGGTVIDFIMRHEKLASVKEALKFLADMTQGQLFSEPSKVPSLSFSFQQPKPNDLEFVGVKPLQSPLIFSYLNRRRINAQLAKQYLLLIHYNNKKKPSERPYFAFGQRNIAGGYEIRSASDGGAKFKSSLIVRDVTLFKGKTPEKKTVSVFEGMLDHLSLLVMLKSDYLNGDAIIMNALSSYQKTLSVIQANGYERVNLFLDNDPAGKKAVEAFQHDLGDKVFDQSQRYAPHKDLNVALVAGYNLMFNH